MGAIADTCREIVKEGAIRVASKQLDQPAFIHFINIVSEYSWQEEQINQMSNMELLELIDRAIERNSG